MTSNKTVYVLGAGFSYPHAPLQKDIVKEILDCTVSNNPNTDQTRFNESKSRLKEFLEKMFVVDDLSRLNLEDLITLLDKAVMSNEFIRENSPQRVRSIRNDLLYCIAYLFDHKLYGTPPPFYNAIAGKIVEMRKSSNDFSIISLNWDLLLDNALHSIMAMDDDIALDYCTYTDNFDKSSNDPPHIHAAARGFKNIKFLKLHGSFNWLHCQNCNRLLIAFDDKIALKASRAANKSKCPKCQVKSLEAVVITPTLIKDLNNVHIKTIWHNAEIELMEAERIVFVGYSFPVADFEFRYLLKRCINKKAKIDLVLDKDEDSKKRYEDFFGKQITANCSYELKAKEYFEKELKFTS